MVDLTNKRSDPDDGVTSDENEIKRCADCGTSKTPLWRTGPAGPKSLCNACGIRNRKRVRVISAEKSKGRVKSAIKFEKGRVFSSTKKNAGGGGSRSTSSTTSGSTITSTISSSSCKIRRSGPTTLDQRLISFGREVMMQRSTVGKRLVRRRKLGEEEQAAVLLMALSYGSVYA